MILHLVPNEPLFSEERSSETAGRDTGSTRTQAGPSFGECGQGGKPVYNWNWVLLLVIMSAGAIGFGGYAGFHAVSWNGAFALFVAMTLVSFVYQYRGRWQHR